MQGALATPPQTAAALRAAELGSGLGYQVSNRVRVPLKLFHTVIPLRGFGGVRQDVAAFPGTAGWQRPSIPHCESAQEPLKCSCPHKMWLGKVFLYETTGNIWVCSKNPFYLSVEISFFQSSDVTVGKSII